MSPSANADTSTSWLQLSRWWLAIVALSTLATGSEAFGLSMMAYKPPVKSSVNKIRSTTRPSRTSTSHKNAYAGALAPPVPLSPQPQRRSFEDRMRDLVLPKKKASPAAAKPAAARPANLVDIETLIDYKKVVADEKDRIVAVRFYSPYCRACKAMAPFYYQMALQHPGTLFVNVPVKPQNANLHQGLGVSSLPYGHIYQPGLGLVEEGSIHKKHLAAFQEKLEQYIQEQSEVVSSKSNNKEED